MYINKVKYIFLFLFFALSLGGGFLFIKSIQATAIIIESEESKTKDLTAVYNQIKWTSTPQRDIWMMNQSHFGRFPKTNQWERLAIVIDKTKKPMTARYYQLKPGTLEWNDNLPNERVPYRASCFTCHANGPRGIRPITSGKNAELSIQDKLKIFALNLRIKSYGRIKYDESHNKEDVTLYPPFHYSAPRELDELKVKTCIRCHNEGSFLARGALVRQQSGTIKHMVESGNMPPAGFKLSINEKKEIRDFLRGF